MLASGKSVVFASSNRNKYEEVAELLAPLQIHLIFGPECQAIDVEEKHKPIWECLYQSCDVAKRQDIL